MTQCLSLTQQLPIKFFIVLKLSADVSGPIPHQIASDVITYVLCSALWWAMVKQAVFTGYCNICTARNTINLSLVVHRCTSVPDQRAVGRLYILSFPCTMICEPAGHEIKYFFSVTWQRRRDVRCIIIALQWQLLVIKAFFHTYATIHLDFNIDINSLAISV